MCDLEFKNLKNEAAEMFCITVNSYVLLLPFGWKKKCHRAIYVLSVPPRCFNHLIYWACRIRILRVILIYHILLLLFQRLEKKVVSSSPLGEC